MIRFGSLGWVGHRDMTAADVTAVYRRCDTIIMTIILLLLSYCRCIYTLDPVFPLRDNDNAYDNNIVTNVY